MKLPGSGRLSITTKIAISLSLLITFLMFSLGFATLFQIKDTVYWGETDKGWYLTGMLASRVAQPLQSGNMALVDRLVRDFKAETGAAGVVVADSQGIVLTAGGAQEDGSNQVKGNDLVKGISETNKAENGFWSGYGQDSSNGQWVFNFTRQIKSGSGQVVGYIGLTTGAGSLHSRVTDMALYLGLTALAAIIAGILLAVVISRRILNQPITDLNLATENIAAGDFSQKVKLHHKDELGNLAMSFNMMTGYLANLFRSIGGYTGELVKSCQTLNKEIESTDNSSRRLMAFIDDYAEKTKNQVGLVQGCSNTATDFVEKVEHSALELYKSAESMAHIVQGVGEPKELLAEAGHDVERIVAALEHMEDAAGQNKKIIGEMTGAADLFADYLDRSRNFNFIIALEVARLGGRNLSGELEQLQAFADEGWHKSKEVINRLKTVEAALSAMEEAIRDGLVAVNRGSRSINNAGGCLEEINAKLLSERDSMYRIMPVLEENRENGVQLLEMLDHIVVDLEKLLQALEGTGQDGRRQTELINRLDATLRRILRVSSTLNNLCLQFKT